MQTLPPEKDTFPDPETGASVTQWTASPAKDQHLYFTSYSVTADDRWLTVLSERDGHPNLYAIERPDGRIFPISRNTAGLLHAYVYPYGGPTGLSKASPALDPDRNRLYWIQDDAVHSAELDQPPGEPRRLARLPEKVWSAFTHVSPDGRTLCVPVTDERAFDPERTSQGDQMRDTVRRIREHGWKSWILFIDTETGASRTVAEVPFWVTHVQFDPEGSGRVVFNMEGGHLIDQRVWALETDGSFRPLYDQAATGSLWDCHENWNPRGGGIVYHGRIDDKPFLASRSWEGGLQYQHFLDPALDFMHATLTVDGRRLLIDQKDGRLGHADAATGSVDVLCRHDSSSREQDCHVHPITTPGGGSVIFTSDRAGVANVYEVGL